MSELTPEERRRIEQYLADEDSSRRQSALQSHQSFVEWLKSTTLGYLVWKLLDLTWTVIKRLFGF